MQASESGHSNADRAFDSDQPAATSLPESRSDLLLQPSGISTPEITADSCLKDIKAVMGDSGLASVYSTDSGPSPFGRTQVHGYKGACFEVMRNGHLASLTLF